MKVDALDAHSSQMYEWGPWTNGREESVAQVPTGKEERKAWLAKRVKRNPGQMSEERRASLEKWYGEKAAKDVKYTEAFEIAENGLQHSDAQLLNFFPMLKPDKNTLRP